MNDCPTLDLVCQGQSLFDGILLSIANVLSAMGYTVVAQAFEGGAGTIQGNEWSVATAMTSRWALVLLVVVVALTIIQMAMALVQGRTQQAASSFIVGVCTWPLTIFTVWLTVTLTDATDRLSVGILNSGGKAGSGVISRMFDIAKVENPLGDLAFQGVIVLIMVSGAWLAGILLSFMLAFRNFALIVLVGFAPVALMGLPLGMTRVVATRWAGLVVSLFLAKPLAAGILVMANELFVKSDATFWQWLVGLVAMAMAAFAPLITMRLFSFAGGDSAGAMGSHGASVVTNTGAGAARGVKSVGGVFK